MATAGEVGASDAAAEQHVAAEDKGRLRTEHVDDVSRRMPRNVEYLQHQAGSLDGIALGNGAVGWRAGNREAERSAQIGIGVGQHDCVLASDEDGAAGNASLSAALPPIWSA